MLALILLVIIPLSAIVGLVLMPPGWVALILLALFGAGLLWLWGDWVTPPTFLGSNDRIEQGFLTLPLILLSAGWAIAALVHGWRWPRRGEVRRGGAMAALGVALVAIFLFVVLRLIGAF